MHRRQVLFSLILVALLTLLVSSVALGKGHIPAGKVQVCHRGVVNEVGAPALRAHLAHGDFQIPACDFNNVFHKEEDCSGGLASPRNSAEGMTPACPEGTF